tara:strand:- start:593 stop:784 length:192 start_codon:yes stop_codon:yes gene_type:complete
MAKKAKTESVGYTSIVLDEKNRDSVQVDFGGNVVWVNREAIKIDKKAKKITMPTWLKEVKGIL